MQPGPRIAALVVASALSVGSCSSSTDGHPPTGSPGSRSASAAAPEHCAAAYCDDFSDPRSGWPTVDGENGAAGYADGGYRVAANHLTTVVEPAPVTVTKFAEDGSVRIDVDATTGHFVAPASLGLSCWLHSTGDGRASGGYTFLVDDLGVTLVRSDDRGAEEQLAKQDAAGALKVDGRRNHLTARCVRSTGTDGALRVDLELDIGGVRVLAASYSDALNLDAGDLGDRVGVVVHGHKDDVLFDDFTVTTAS